MILLLPATGFAALNEPALKSSGQLDMSRAGKVSADERSVLRIEWQAGQTGVDEAHNVQQMLDSLRRIDGTLGEIKGLVRQIPDRDTMMPAAVATAAAPGEPADVDVHGARMVNAGLITALLAILWWYRRRNFAKYRATVGADPGLPEAAPPAPAADMAPPAEPAGHAPIQKSLTAIPVSGIASEAAQVQAAPTEPAGPAPKPDAALPAAAFGNPSPAIDFSLDEADPETIARESARRTKEPSPIDTSRPPTAPEEAEGVQLEPTLELAEIMLSLGLEQGAAKALVEYTEVNPREAIHHWLKLLSIYRSTGHRQDFKETAEKLRKHFNVQAEDWADRNKGDVPTLEKFPRVAEQVQQLWSRPQECIDYLKSLLADNRDGERTGFPQAVAEEMLLLIEILKRSSGIA